MANATLEIRYSDNTVEEKYLGALLVEVAGYKSVRDVFTSNDKMEIALAAGTYNVDFNEGIKIVDLT